MLSASRLSFSLMSWSNNMSNWSAVLSLVATSLKISPSLLLYVASFFSGGSFPSSSRSNSTLVSYVMSEGPGSFWIEGRLCFPSDRRESPVTHSDVDKYLSILLLLEFVSSSLFSFLNVLSLIEGSIGGFTCLIDVPVLGMKVAIGVVITDSVIEECNGGFGIKLFLIGVSSFGALIS